MREFCYLPHGTVIAYKRVRVLTTELLYTSSQRKHLTSAANYRRWLAVPHCVANVRTHANTDYCKYLPRSALAAVAMTTAWCARR